MLNWLARSSFFLSIAAIAGAIGLLVAGSQVPGQALAVNAVSVGDNFFSPQSIAVNAGEAVEWKNDGNLPHTVTSDTGTFDSGLVMKTNAFSQTFEVAGTFTYYCAVHPEMVGTVVVEAPVQPTPEPTAAPADPGPAPAQPAAPNPATADVDVVAPEPGTLPVGGGPPIAPEMARGPAALIVAGILFAALGGGATALAARGRSDAV